jgi:hypothetical protein
MEKLKNLWNKLPDGVKRVVHTAWQVAVPVLLSHLIIAHSSSDVKSAFVVTGAAVLAAVKALIIS